MGVFSSVFGGVFAADLCRAVHGLGLLRAERALGQHGRGSGHFVRARVFSQQQDLLLQASLLLLLDDPDQCPREAAHWLL